MLVRLLPFALLACSTPKPEASRTSEPVKTPPATKTPEPAAEPAHVVMPGGEAGIGFDDLRFSSKLQRVLVPGGRTGKLDLVDPANHAIESIEGFSSEATFGGGHGQGPTSVDENSTFLFAIDRGKTEVLVIDETTKKIASTAKLGGNPDYVRWVESTKEVWVTEPNKKQIEFFSFDGSHLARKGTLSVAGGPESLAIDGTRGRAYTHTWDDATVVIDLAKHAELARWKNGCEGSRGIALDEKRGFLFIGCEEGKATALDVAHDGRALGSVATGKGVDIIAYAPALAHLYVPGGDSATLTIVSVDGAGKLGALGTVPAADDSHCVTTDDAGHAYVCDPKRGALIVVADPYPATR